MSLPQQPPAAPPSPPSPSSSSTRRLLVIGSVVLSVGAWLLLHSLGVPVPDLSRHWPLFLLLGGVASLLDYFFLSSRPAACGIGVFGLGLGILFYLFSLSKLSLGDISLWGPAIPLVLGLAFLATWFVGQPRAPSLLTLGVVGLGLALSGWGWRIVRIESLWALVLLAIGGFFIWRAVKQGRSNRPTSP